MGVVTARRAAVGGVLALGLVLSACGSSPTSTSAPAAGSGGGSSSYGSGSSSSSSSSGGAASGGAAAVRLTSVSKVGKVLVDSSGYTLYVFSKDTNHQSHCTGACAKVWPPLLTSGKATAGSGASSSLLGTVKNPDGKTQVTYAGSPLYTFSADTKPGEAKGQGLVAFGGKWAAVTTAGKPVGAAAAASSSSSSSSGSGSGW